MSPSADTDLVAGKQFRTIPWHDGACFIHHIRARSSVKDTRSPGQVLRKDALLLKKHRTVSRCFEGRALSQHRRLPGHSRGALKCGATIDGSIPV